MLPATGKGLRRTRRTRHVQGARERLRECGRGRGQRPGPARAPQPPPPRAPHRGAEESEYLERGRLSGYASKEKEKSCFAVPRGRPARTVVRWRAKLPWHGGGMRAAQLSLCRCCCGIKDTRRLRSMRPRTFNTRAYPVGGRDPPLDLGRSGTHVLVDPLRDAPRTNSRPGRR
jgi:hypothetical protein